MPELAQERGAQTEPGRIEGRVCRRASGRVGEFAVQQSDDALHFIVVHEHHATLVAGDMKVEKLVRHAGEQVHDG
jgi:hypothetical protein